MTVFFYNFVLKLALMTFFISLIQFHSILDIWVLLVSGFVSIFAYGVSRGYIDAGLDV